MLDGLRGHGFPCLFLWLSGSLAGLARAGQRLKRSLPGQDYCAVPCRIISCCRNRGQPRHAGNSAPFPQPKPQVRQFGGDRLIIPAKRGTRKQCGRGLSDRTGLRLHTKAADPPRLVYCQRKFQRAAASRRTRTAMQRQLGIMGPLAKAGRQGEHVPRVKGRGTGQNQDLVWSRRWASASTASLRRSAIILTSASLLALTKG